MNSLLIFTTLPMTKENNNETSTQLNLNIIDMNLSCLSRL